MLLGSFFMLNRTTTIDCHTIYPYIHSFSNHTSTEAMLRPVKVPDVNPAGLPKDSNFSLVAGDFLDVYGDEVSCMGGYTLSVISSETSEWSIV